jgi:tetratricopeptide (TPR) repeat protein
MQRLFKQIWQSLRSFFGQLFGSKATQTNRRQSHREEAQDQLSDTDYEFLFSQLLEGIAHGWHEGRILKFFQQLEDRGKQRQWVAWLERFGARVMASPAPNQQLAARMMRLGELAQSFPAIEEIGRTSYTVGRQIYNKNVGNVIWEYDGPDVEMPRLSTNIELEASPMESLTQPQDSINNTPEAEGTETITLDELLSRLQQDETLVAQMAQELGVETDDPQAIIETLIQQFQNAQQQMETQTEPQTVEDWFNRGLQQANAGDLENAIASWENALALNPNLAQAWHNRGSALGHLGRMEEAIASYNKAIELNPNDPQAWNARAHALYNLQRWEEAIICWDKVIELEPDLAQIWYNRGCALENGGRIDAAIASFRKALEVQPDFELAQSKLNQIQNSP